MQARTRSGAMHEARMLEELSSAPQDLLAGRLLQLRSQCNHLIKVGRALCQRGTLWRYVSAIGQALGRRCL